MDDGRARAPQGDLQRAGPQAQPKVRDGATVQAPRDGHQDGQALAAPLPDSARARGQPRLCRRQERTGCAPDVHAGRHGRRRRGSLRARHGRRRHVTRWRRRLRRGHGRDGPGRRWADGRRHVRRHHRRHAAARQDRSRAEPPGERASGAREASPGRAHQRGSRDCLPGCRALGDDCVHDVARTRVEGFRRRARRRATPQGCASHGVLPRGLSRARHLPRAPQGVRHLAASNAAPAGWRVALDGSLGARPGASAGGGGQPRARLLPHRAGGHRARRPRHRRGPRPRRPGQAEASREARPRGSAVFRPGVPAGPIPRRPARVAPPQARTPRPGAPAHLRGLRIPAPRAPAAPGRAPLLRVATRRRLPTVRRSPAAAAPRRVPRSAPAAPGNPRRSAPAAAPRRSPRGRHGG
mmetsp:Transcript_8588/g.38997  ORF Transcript_8588/g.38997 Transcript_8588/m.38997 type:complete len:410 (+) Transcript_8588:1562-2791(+)